MNLINISILVFILIAIGEVVIALLIHFEQEENTMSQSLDINQYTVLNTLSQHIGQAKGIKVSDLVYKITGNSPTEAQERLVRTVITELRMEGHHVCALPSTGYFIAANEAELEDTCQHLYNRGMKSLVQVSCMKKISIPDLHGQMKLLN